MGSLRASVAFVNKPQQDNADHLEDAEFIFAISAQITEAALMNADLEVRKSTVLMRLYLQDNVVKWIS